VERITDNGATRYYYDGAKIITEANIVNEVIQPVASNNRGKWLEFIDYPDGTRA
jgi:hypothetical protein